MGARNERGMRVKFTWCNPFDFEFDSGFGSRVSGSGFQVPGFGFRVPGLGFRDSDLRFWDSGLGFQVSGSGFLVSWFGFQISGFVFRVLGFRLWLYVMSGMRATSISCESEYAISLAITCSREM